MMTYADLVASVAEDMQHDFTGGQIDRFIRFAEAEMGRRLSIPETEALVETQLAKGESLIERPANFQRLRSLRLTSGEALQQADPDNVAALAAISGLPAHFSVVADGFRLAPTPAAALGLQLLYITTWPQLSADQQTNAVLQRYPDLYDAGVKFQAALFTRDEVAATAFGDRFETLLDRVSLDLARARNTDRRPLISPYGD